MLSSEEFGDAVSYLEFIFCCFRKGELRRKTNELLMDTNRVFSASGT